MSERTAVKLVLTSSCAVMKPEILVAMVVKNKVTAVVNPVSNVVNTPAINVIVVNENSNV